jgi:4-hydroxy-tetrahydrodipicolinate reductase
MDHAEIIELHHDKKLDAPSGTSLLTAKAMLRPVASLSCAAAANPRRAGAADREHQHPQRTPAGFMAHQEVIFGGGADLSIRHDTINRECYTPVSFSP